MDKIQEAYEKIKGNVDEKKLAQLDFPKRIKELEKWIKEHAAWHKKHDKGM